MAFRKSVNKRRSAKKFRRSINKTRRINLLNPMRGGIRL